MSKARRFQYGAGGLPNFAGQTPTHYRANEVEGRLPMH